MASIRKIKKAGNTALLDDLKFVREIMVWSSETGSYFRTTRRELLTTAEYKLIRYEISDTIFLRKRKVLVIF